MEHEKETKLLHYTVGHELGVAAGFAGLIIVSAFTFLLSWRAYNKKEEKREAERKAGLIERGFGPLEKEKKGPVTSGDQNEDGERQAEGGSAERKVGGVGGDGLGYEREYRGFGGDGSGERSVARP